MSRVLSDYEIDEPDNHSRSSCILFLPNVYKNRNVVVCRMGLSICLCVVALTPSILYFLVTCYIDVTVKHRKITCLFTSTRMTIRVTSIQFSCRNAYRCTQFKAFAGLKRLYAVMCMIADSCLCWKFFQLIGWFVSIVSTEKIA